MTLYIGLLNASDRNNATVYLSHLDPCEEGEAAWDEFEKNVVEFRDKTHMPSDITIGILTNVLQAAGVCYTRIDI